MDATNLTNATGPRTKRPKAREMAHHGEPPVAGWRRVTQPGKIRVTLDGSCHLSLKDRTACPGLELLSCELLANQAADADVLVLNVQYTKHRHKHYHARKAWVKTLVSPCSLSRP